MRTVVRTATEARTEFFDLINAAKHGGQITLITKNGKVAAKIVPEMTADSPLSLDRVLKQTAGLFTKADQKATQEFRNDINQKLAHA